MLLPAHTRVFSALWVVALLVTVAACGNEPEAPKENAPAPMRAAVSIVIDHKKAAGVSLDAIREPTPLSTLLPEAQQDPSTWVSLVVQASDGVSWRRGNPAESAPGFGARLLVGDAGKPAFEFTPGPSKNAGRAALIQNVELVEIITKAEARRSDAKRRQANLTLRVIDEEGTESSLDLNSIDVAAGLPSQSGRRHAQPGGGSRQGGGQGSRSWWLRDVLGRIRHGSAAVAVQLSTASGEAIDLSARDMAASSPQRLLHVNRRGILMYRELVDGERTKQVAEVREIVLRKP